MKKISPLALAAALTVSACAPNRFAVQRECAQRFRDQVGHYFKCVDAGMRREPYVVGTIGSDAPANVATPKSLSRPVPVISVPKSIAHPANSVESKPKPVLNSAKPVSLGQLERMNQTIPLDEIRKIFDYHINRYRNSKLHEKLEYDSLLNQVAQDYADWNAALIAKTNNPESPSVLQHRTKINGVLSTPPDRALQHGYKPFSPLSEGEIPCVRENIYFVASSDSIDLNGLAYQLFAKWQNSPSHNANMLDQGSRDLGLGLAPVEYRDGGQRMIGVVGISLYGTRENACIEAQ